MFSKAFQRKYALTDQGLKNTKSGAFWTVVTNLVVMGGMGILYLLMGGFMGTLTDGALGAVCIAIRFLFMLVGGISPYVWFATHFVDAILIGPVFMLLVAKIRKNGPFLITSLVTGLVLVSATWMFPITGLVGGILCELCLKAGQFQKKGWLVLGFFCFNLGFIGDFLPLWFTKESYLEYAAQMMDPGYMTTMEGLLTWPVFGVIVLSILVGSILGALLGMKLMRKHFVKAGLAQ